MAEKALFHAVDMRNGHEKWWCIVPAPNSEYAKSLFQTRDIAVTKVTCLNWRYVNIGWNGDIVFSVVVDENNIDYEKGDPGYEYLLSHFSAKVNQVIQEQRDFYEPYS